MSNPRWAVGSNQYRKRARPATAEPSVTLPAPTLANRERKRRCGIDWDEARIDVEAIGRSSVDRARARFRAQLPELVWNAAALEGNTYTLPEVRTLLEGVTVGGPLGSEFGSFVADETKKWATIVESRNIRDNQ